MNTENLCMGCMREKGEGIKKCLRCGYVEGSPFLPSYLAPKTLLSERYLVGKVLSYNGMGATYIAFDMIENLRVKIREYMPENLASRDKGNPEVKVNPGSEIQFKSLKMDYIDLVKKLMKLNSLSEVEHVKGMFEANNTVYVVYEYIEGMTLSEFLKKNGGYLSWEDTKQLFMPLLSCVSAIHTSELIHRGISPDTIMVDRSGNLKLTSFEIAPARTARSEIIAQLYPGYTAPEQYTSSAWQGQYTDVYALAAIIYRSLTGTMPVEAISRISNDNLVAASSLNSSIPKNVSNALASAMALSPEKRTESVSLLISQLSETLDFGAAAIVDEDTEVPVEPEKKKMKDSTKYTIIAAAIAAPVLIILMVVLLGIIFPSDKPDDTASNTSNINSHNFSSDSEVDDNSSDVMYKYSVPNFVSKNINAILADEDYMQRFKITHEFVYSEEYGENVIIEQSVEAGTPVEKDGLEIKLTVSRGSSFRELPNLVGKNLDYAKETLHRMFIYYEVKEKEDAYGETDVVIEMSDEPGTIINISQPYTVTLYINKDISLQPEEPEYGFGDSDEDVFADIE